MVKTEPKHPVGTRVKIINERHRNGEVGHVEEITSRTVLNDSKGYIYYIRFKDGLISSFFEANIKEVPYTAFFVKEMLAEYKEKKVRNIGAISTVFAETEITACDIFKESFDLSAIREVTEEDVTDKYFADWFFKMDDWVGITPETFPFSMIVHNDEFFVYGYFNGDKLDGIIRVDEYSDNCELSFFFVNKSLQNKGIGQYLFRYVLKRFSDKKLILSVYKDNVPAIHIYKKYGFKIMCVGYGMGYKPESPHYIMQKDVR